MATTICSGRDAEARVGPILVLSLFPGIGLLDMAFEQEGFCVVRGPDLLWGGDVRNFHVPGGVFDGVIGGPPCQAFSSMRFLNPTCGKHRDLIPEFERVVAEAKPQWFIMENVAQAPLPTVAGYIVTSLLLDNRWLGEEQRRLRRFSFGSHDGAALVVDVALFESPYFEQCVTAGSRLRVPVRLGGGGKEKRTWAATVRAGHSDTYAGPQRSLAEICRLQGLAEDFLADAPFTVHGKRAAVGNGVPLPMGRAIARAVRRAMAHAALGLAEEVARG